MQADPKSSGCPTKPGVPEERPVLWGKASAAPIFESRAVYTSNEQVVKWYTRRGAQRPHDNANSSLKAHSRFCLRALRRSRFGLLRLSAWSDSFRKSLPTFWSEIVPTRTLCAAERLPRETFFKSFATASMRSCKWCKVS